MPLHLAAQSDTIRTIHPHDWEKGKYHMLFGSCSFEGTLRGYPFLTQAWKVASQSSAISSSFFKFLSVLLRRGSARIRLVSGSSVFSSFWGMATRYQLLLFHTWVRVCQYVLCLTSWFPKITYRHRNKILFHRSTGSFTNKARVTGDRVLAASFPSGAPMQLHLSGPRRAMGPPVFPRKSKWE